MALEPKCEEERDLRMGVVERDLEDVLRRYLASGEVEMRVVKAGRPDPGVAGPQPRGSILVKEKGLLGKKLAEFHSTGSWEIANGHEELFKPVQEELRKRIRLEVARENLRKLSLVDMRSDVAEETGSAAVGPRSYRNLLGSYLRATIEELEAQLGDANRERLEELRSRRIEAAQEAATLLPSPPVPWQRDLIPM